MAPAPVCRRRRDPGRVGVTDSMSDVEGMFRAGASTSTADLAPMPPMGGFELSFYLPFERTHIYDELLVHPRVRQPGGQAIDVRANNSIAGPGAIVEPMLVVGPRRVEPIKGAARSTAPPAA